MAGPTTALSYLSWTAAPLPPRTVWPTHPQAPKLGLPWALGTPSPQGARPSGLCPLLGGQQEGGLRWGGPRALWRHEHIKLDEWRGDDSHLGVQRVEAEVDAAQGRHGGQLLHGHICWEEKDRLGGPRNRKTSILSGSSSPSTTTPGLSSWCPALGEGPSGSTRALQPHAEKHPRKDLTRVHARVCVLARLSSEAERGGCSPALWTETGTGSTGDWLASRA